MTCFFFNSVNWNSVLPWLWMATAGFSCIHTESAFTLFRYRAARPSIPADFRILESGTMKNRPATNIPLILLHRNTSCSFSSSKPKNQHRSTGTSGRNTNIWFGERHQTKLVLVEPQTGLHPGGKKKLFFSRSHLERLLPNFDETLVLRNLNGSTIHCGPFVCPSARLTCSLHKSMLGVEVVF